MIDHLTKGCPLTVDMIAKKRRYYERWANTLFGDLPLPYRKKVVTGRVILFMDKFRNQTVLDFPINIRVDEK